MVEESRQPQRDSLLPRAIGRDPKNSNYAPESS